MASKATRKVGAARTYQVLEQTDLTGGLDLRRAPTLLQPERARYLMNFSLSEPGSLRVRPGYLAWSTHSLGSSGGQGGARVYTSDTQFTLFAWGGALYQPTDSGGLSTAAVLTGLSGTADMIHLVYDRNLVAVMDSTSTPQKSTNGTDWTRLGILASTTVSTLVAGASTGTLSTSEFELAYTYKDRGLAYESNGSPVSTISVGSTGQDIKLNVPNSTDAQVDAIVVYARNKTAGETVLRKASSAAQSSGVSSTILVASSNWSANAEIPTTHTHAPVLRFACNWKNRWWGADATVGNRLWFTELFQPQAWYSLYYIDIPFARGDKIEALVAQGDTLVVFGSTGSFLVLGITSLDFEVRPSAGAQTGALGPRAIEVIEGGVAHAASEGVYVFDGATDKLLSHDIEPGWRDLIDHTASTGLAKVAMVYDYLQKELRIAVPRLYPIATYGEWVLDLNRTREGNTPAWTQTDRTIGGYITWAGDEPVAGNRGKILSWSPTAGRLTQEGTGTTANSSNLTAQYEGPAFSLGLTRARFVDLHAEVEPHAGAFSVEIVTDGISRGSLGLSIGAGAAVYGTAVYGTDIYAGAGRTKCYTELPLATEGRSVVVKGSYTGRESFSWFGYAVGLVPETRPRQWTE